MTLAHKLAANAVKESFFGTTLAKIVSSPARAAPIWPKRASGAII